MIEVRANFASAGYRVGELVWLVTPDDPTAGGFYRVTGRTLARRLSPVAALVERLKRRHVRWTGTAPAPMIVIHDGDP